MSDLILGLLLTASSGWGFSSGLAAEAGFESPHVRVMLAASNEVKSGNEDGYTYAASLTAFLPVQRLAFGMGVTRYGYHASQWSKAVTAPLIEVEYRADDVVGGASYVFEDGDGPAVLGLHVRSRLGGRAWFTAALQRAMSEEGLGGSVGLQLRW